MIIKVLEQLVTNKHYQHEDGTQEIEEILGKTVVKKMEIDEITDFCEMVNSKTKKPYKKRCLLRTQDGGWIVVNHSFEELSVLKREPQRAIVRGFYDKVPTGSNKVIRRSK